MLLLCTRFYAHFWLTNCYTVLFYVYVISIFSWKARYVQRSVNVNCKIYQFILIHKWCALLNQFKWGKLIHYNVIFRLIVKFIQLEIYKTKCKTFEHIKKRREKATQKKKTLNAPKKNCKYAHIYMLYV